MSNRKKLRPTKPRRTAPAATLIRSLNGARIPGGCHTCDAYQTIHADAHGPGLHRIAVHHDDWCPTYGHIIDTRRAGA
ncbi:hypothetical protein M3G91_32710 [Micromonospora chalcea]|uniref:hypothetical protein n=1 Tax=Micromonospora chalcea TaxID=1874 RepID=UPI0021A85CFA|nr:hypothetical protein [Micromonospora chalcea]MCT2282370.1 hypothetical protein [Micromonospora chalcea]